MSTIDDVRALVEPMLEHRGLDLYDIEFDKGRLRVSVDGSDGLPVDALTDLTRELSRALDDQDPVPGRYTLEVSSPGLERPLRRPEHFRRAVGDEVTVKTVPGAEGERRARGTLIDADDDGITIRLDDTTEAGPGPVGDEGPVRQLGYDEILTARTRFQWGPDMAPSDNRPGKKAAS
jgi:ribosome maturation factor RimP